MTDANGQNTNRRDTLWAMMRHTRRLLLFFEFIGSAYTMKLVVQRVKSASVTVEGQVVSKIGPGILALVGLQEHDTEQDLQYCCKRLLGCKLWANESSAWRHSVKQKSFELLCVSQFTLYGTLSKKHQPDYKRAMKSVPAAALYDKFLDMLRDEYRADMIFDGVFGAMMDVELVNDGPVTLVIESEPNPTHLANAAEKKV
jgi:D-aminoacyl-tRNA deacylase